MSKFLRHLMLASLFVTGFLAVTVAAFAGRAFAQQVNPGGGPTGWPGGTGGRSGRGRGPVGPPSDGAAPSGGANRPGASADAAPKAVVHVTGEHFYMVASLDPGRMELLLKEPTEVTLLMTVSGSTQYLDENSKAMKLTGLRAGDTVWVTSSAGQAEPVATRIREGQMTQAELHRTYLDYPEIK